MKPVTKDLGKVMMTMEGEYNSEREYEVLSVVSFEDISYISKKNVPSNIPVTNKEYWQFFGSLGNTPKLRKNIEIEYIEVSYDNGEHWKQLIALSEITGPQGIQGVKGEPAVAIENYITTEATLETIDVTDVLPSVGSADTVYRVSNWDGVQYNETAYSEYGWYDDTYKKLATRQIGIDNEPIINSQNIVKSGGVAAQISQLGQNVDGLNFKSSKESCIYPLEHWEEKLEGYHLTSTNTIVSDQNTYVTPLIPVTSGDTIVWNFGSITNSVALMFYKSDFEFIAGSGVVASGERTVTAPQNAAYIIATMPYDSSKKAYIYINDVLKWVTPDNADKYINNKEYNDVKQINKSIYEAINLTEGYYLDANGNLVENAEYGYSDYIPIISTDPIDWFYGANFTTSAKLVVYDSSKARINNYSPFSTSIYAPVRHLDGVAPNSAAYIRISVKLSNIKYTKLVRNGTVVYGGIISTNNGLKKRIEQLENKDSKSFVKLRIAQFNEGHYDRGVGVGFPNADAYNKAKDAYKNAISGLMADILFANEHSQELIAGTTGNPSYDAFYKPFFPYKATTEGADYANWITIFSKFKLNNVTTGTTPDSSQGGSGRKFLSVYVDINGRNVRLVCFHPLPPVDGGTVDAEYIVGLCQDDEYVIIGSDTNDAEGVWTNVFTEAGYQAGNHGFWGDFTTCYSGLPASPKAIDNIFVKGFQMNFFNTFHQIYQCKTANNDATFDLSKWTPIAIQDDRLPLKEHWEAGHQYAVGDFCYYPYPNDSTSSADHYFITSDHQPVLAEITTDD